jgi:hypothetical protein
MCQCHHAINARIAELEARDKQSRELAALLERLERWLPVEQDDLARMDHNDIDTTLAQLKEHAQ